MGDEAIRPRPHSLAVAEAGAEFRSVSYFAIFVPAPRLSAHVYLHIYIHLNGQTHMHACAFMYIYHTQVTYVLCAPKHIYQRTVQIFTYVLLTHVGTVYLALTHRYTHMHTCSDHTMFIHTPCTHSALAAPGSSLAVS